MIFFSFNNKQIEGNLKDLPRTAEHIFFYMTEKIKGDLENLPRSAEMIDFGCNENIQGDLKDLLQPAEIMDFGCNEKMQGDLKDATDAENTAIAEFEGLVSAKEKEIAAATEAIESKTARAGELAVKLVSLKNDLGDAQDSLADDTKYLAELKKQCADNDSEYEERQAMRSQELVAISETVKILNDDDALDLFKKTLPSPALLQTVKSADRKSVV